MIDRRLLFIGLSVYPMKKSNRKINLKINREWQSTELVSIIFIVKKLDPLLILVDGLVVPLKKTITREELS